MTFRGFLMWVHLGLGLTGAAIIAILAVTGAYITFQNPLQRWLNPVPAIPAFTGAPDFPAIVSAVERSAPSQQIDWINVFAEQATIVRLRNRTTVFVDPVSNRVISMRPVRTASLVNLTAVMRRLHTSLLVGRKGTLILIFATAETVLLALTGLWLWWRKKHWRFGAWRGSLFRVSWDIHSATGIWFLIPVLSMALTGVLMGFPNVVYRMAGAGPAPRVGTPRSSEVDAGASRISLSRVVSVADSALPGERTVRLVIPGNRAGAFAVTKSGTTVYIDQFSGAVLDTRTAPVPTDGDLLYQDITQLHTGELLGTPGRTIMTLGCLMLAVMTVTGAVLGLKRLSILLGRATTTDAVT